MTTKHDRVLMRAGARELSQQEAQRVQGGISTTTACTFEPPNFKDGDPGEC